MGVGLPDAFSRHRPPIPDSRRAKGDPSAAHHLESDYRVGFSATYGFRGTPHVSQHPGIPRRCGGALPGASERDIRDHHGCLLPLLVLAGTQGAEIALKATRGVSGAGVQDQNRTLDEAVRAGQSRADDAASWTRAEPGS